MPNKLSTETSPYLLQHANNPVDWHPWAPETLDLAKTLDKPILLSIGYSACHWCHVMEHESFENPAIAQLMNERFINIKVDREERPDLDQIYMNAVQIMTGSGGWPLTVFLLPTTEPFYGGTYFPPEDRYGRPGFPRLLEAISEAYRLRKDELKSNAQLLLGHLNQPHAAGEPGTEVGTALLDQAARSLGSRFDFREGGFGAAPKFPPSMALDFLMRYNHRTQDEHALQMVNLTLEKMAFGGIYDQAGGGFHRYSVDDRWLVPHFEKMLYDNALLARAYLDAHRLTHRPLYRRITEEILDFVIREMRSPDGGFYSTQDADSEGVEGKFYVWQSEEFKAVVGNDGELLARYFDVTGHGNWEHQNILNIPRAPEVFCKLEQISESELDQKVQAARKKLYEAREHRIHPGRDEKILTDWNGLMLRAFAEAAAYLGRPDYERVAVSNAEFILNRLWDGDHLLHNFKDGRARFNAYLDDYANFADGLFSLYELTFDKKWLDLSATMADIMISRFWDQDRGGFFFTAEDHETLIARNKDIFDNATPSGNSVAAEVLQKLGALLNRTDYRTKAESMVKANANLVLQFPSGFGRLLAATDFYVGPTQEIALVGGSEPFIGELRKRYTPRTLVAAGDTDSLPLLMDRRPIDGRATAYVCENFTCQQPVTDVAQFLEQLRV